MRPELYTFTAVEASLPLLLAQLSSIAMTPGEDIRLRAQTAVEELFANTLEHGYAGAAKSVEPLVWLAVWLEGDILHLRYEDAAPRYNPLDHLDTVIQPTQMSLESRPVGGLGRLMVQGLSDSARYQWIETETGAHNRIELTFSPRQPLPTS